MAPGSHRSWPGGEGSIFSDQYISLVEKGIYCRAVMRELCVCTKSTAKIVQKGGSPKTSEEIFILDTHSMISILEAGIFSI